MLPYYFSLADDRGQEIVEQVVKRYQSMKSYQDVGTATAPRKDHPPFNFTRKFTTTFTSPSLFKQEWVQTQEKGLCRGTTQGAIWADGKRFFRFSQCGSYGFQEAGDYESFVGLLGNLGAINQHHIYHLLFLEGQPRLLQDRSGKYSATLVGEESVGTRKAYVVLVQHNYVGNNRVKYWIEKDSYLILKYEAPAIGGGVPTIELSNIICDEPLPKSAVKKESPGAVMVTRKAAEMIQRGDLEGATALLEKALSDQYDSGVQYMLALTYAMSGNEDKALVSAEKAAESCNPEALKFVTEKYTPESNMQKAFYWNRKSKECYGYAN